MQCKQIDALFAKTTVFKVCQIINKTIDTIMGTKGGLSNSENATLTSELAKGKCTLEISKMIGRYHQTVKNFVKNPAKARKRANKGKSSVVLRRSLLQIKPEVTKHPVMTSREILNQAGLKDVSKSTRCRRLKEVSKQVSPVKKPPLKKHHIQNRLKWV